MSEITVYHDLREIELSVTNSRTGYPAANMAENSVAKSWRSNSNTAAVSISILDLGWPADKVYTPVDAVLYNGVNWREYALSRSWNGIPAEQHNLATEANGRSKLLVTPESHFPNDDFWLYLGAQETGSIGASVDDYHEIGTTMLFGSRKSVLCPEYGYTISYGAPRRDYRLPNGRMVWWDIGTKPAAATITLTWLALEGEDPGALWQLAQQPVLLVINRERGHFWPVIAAPDGCQVRARSSVFTAMQGTFLEIA